MERNIYKIGKELFITNGEEIKQGDWYLVNQWGNGLLLATQPASSEDIKYQHKFECKKIILTTDEDLIKNGVQAIDDTFLEWFVKNPSCECVEVNTYTKKIGTETDANGYRQMDVFGEDYRITIS